MDPLTGGMATDHPPRLCISGAPPDERGQAIHMAIAEAAREAGIDARRLEVVERAKEKLRELIEAREVKLDSREVEVAVFGEPFRVERIGHFDDSREGDDIASDGNYDYRMRYGWLTRDEIVGSICRWCAGIGVNPDLSRNKRMMLWQWQREPEQFTTGPDNTRVVRGVSFDWPFAQYMRHPFAEQIMRELCITDAEARCPRCQGWGDERSDEVLPLCGP